jgi:hypothetical protein
VRIMDYFFEFIFSPKGGTTGQALIQVINSLDLLSRFPYVVIADVECNENRAWASRPPFASTCKEVIDYAMSVSQFDWGTFFFFREPGLGTICIDQFAALFANASLVIRVVDDTYFYVYSTIEDDASQLGQHGQVQVQKKLRSDVEHPF